MTAILWRVVERRLRRRLPREQVAPVLGDLEEDFARRCASHGRTRAALWLLAETNSLAGAYGRERRAARPTRSLRMLTLVAEESRLAVRRLRKRPAAAIVSVVTLALAIGAGAATWSMLSALLLKPLPVKGADRVVLMGTESAQPNGKFTRVSTSLLYTVAEGARGTGVFADAAIGGAMSLPSTRTAQPISVYFTTPNFFDLLGVPLALGVPFTDADNHPGAPPRAVASYRFWRTTLGGDTDAIGKDIDVAQQHVTIVGIAAKGFRGLTLAAAPDLYVPIRTAHTFNSVMNFFAEPSTQMSPSMWVGVIGRMRPDESAASSAALLSADLAEVSRGSRISLLPIETTAIPEVARASMTHFAQLLAITVALLIVIGALTVGMLLLVRTEARRGELGMCVALGATRGRLASGIAIEGVLLAMTGAALAFPVTVALFGVFRAFQLPGGIDIGLLDLSLDTRVMAATSIGALAAGSLVVLIACGFGARAHVDDALRAKGSTASRPAQRRTRTTIVAAQIAISVALLSAAGLFARSLVESLRLNAGFDTKHLISTFVQVGGFAGPPARATEFGESLITALRGNPAVRSISATNWMGGMTPVGTLTVDGVPRRFGTMVDFDAVDANYFRTVGMPILRGRDFAATDTSTAPLVVIVSESFGRKLAYGGNPLGHHVTEMRGKLGQPFATLEIVGVVPDVITDVQATEPLAIYYALAQATFPSTTRTFFVRATSDPAAAAREVTAAIRAIDPTLRPSPMLTIDQRIAKQMSPQRLGALILGALSTIALVLTVMGMYVVAASMAAERRREAGIRAALGATRTQVGALILRQTAWIAGLGLAAGLALARLGAGTIRGLLFRVQPMDTATLAVVTVGLLSVALIVSLGPALATARLDLAQTLREE